MARVTVEDCILRVPNRFELVLLASQRARDISAGSPLTLARDDDKNPVVALREIADKTISTEHLEAALIQGQQRYAGREEAEEDEPEFDVLEGELEASARMAAEGLASDQSQAGSGSGEGEDENVSLDALAEAEADTDTGADESGEEA